MEYGHDAVVGVDDVLLLALCISTELKSNLRLLHREEDEGHGVLEAQLLVDVGGHLLVKCVDWLSRSVMASNMRYCDIIFYIKYLSYLIELESDSTMDAGELNN